MPYNQIPPDAVLTVQTPYGSRAFSRDQMAEVLGKPAGALTTGDLKILEASEKIRGVIHDNPNLTDAEKRRILNRISAMAMNSRTGGDLRLPEVQALAIAAGEMVYDAERQQHTALAEAEIFESLKSPLRLQKPTGSVFHKARAAFQRLDVLIPVADAKPLGDELRDTLDNEHQIFVVEHNWAAAFDKAGDFDGGELMLPHFVTAFEFQINSLRWVFSCCQVTDGNGIKCIPMVQTSHGWALTNMYDFRDGRLQMPTPRGNITPAILAMYERDEFLRAVKPAIDLGGAQMKAIIVALEAEVATSEIIRAPHKLNAKRERAGKLPLVDYHVVNLARRARPAPLDRGPYDPDREPGTRKRLHFRRGHWRHYEDHKTWIKWMLVGDPDLGFIDKHYRL